MNGVSRDRQEQGWTGSCKENIASGEQESKLKQADTDSKLINMGHWKWKKIAPCIWTVLWALYVIPYKYNVSNEAV